MPLYGDSVVYTQTLEIAEPAQHYRVSLPAWHGSVAEVVVNGQSAGYVWCQPWQRDVTGLMKAGANTIGVRMIGTTETTPQASPAPNTSAQLPKAARPRVRTTAPWPMAYSSRINA